MKFTKLDRTNRTDRSNRTYKKTVLLLVCFLLLGLAGSAEAGKVKDIVKRSKIRSSIFAPAGRPVQTQIIRNSVFFSPLETAITGGPAHNSAIQTTKVEFAFDGWQILPFEKVKRFDVWLIGYDGGWKEAGNKVSYNLPPGQKTYTLLARAKNSKGEFDNTAAVRTFMVSTSRHFGKVKINNVNHKGPSNKPNYEKISIINRSSDLGVNVTGWVLKTKRFNDSFEIPQAARVFNARDLNAIDNIVLNQSGAVDIYVGKRSPLGVNFQENSCDGYMTSSFEGYDSLSGAGRCSLPSPSDYNSFSLSCRSFLNNINSCRAPRLEYYSFINEPSCREFITKNYNYQACVDRAKNQASFYLGRWKVYLGRNAEILDDLDDTLYLYDDKGLLVDAYRY